MIKTKTIETKERYCDNCGLKLIGYFVKVTGKVAGYNGIEVNPEYNYLDNDYCQTCWDRMVGSFKK